MKNFKLTYKPYGEFCILIEWPSRIEPSIIQDIISFDKLLKENQKVKQTTIAYNSILVQLIGYSNYNIDSKSTFGFENMVSNFKQLYKQERLENKTKQKCWEIPVCYDLDFGIDLEKISKTNNISISKIIELHTQPNYLVYFLGFQPGFFYLGGLKQELYFPRRANPRLRLDEGSVGIGGQQTGIYPQSSAGGWNIIGKSPIKLFDVLKNQPCFVKAGDYIKFISINKKEYFRIAKSFKNQIYKPQYLWI